MALAVLAAASMPAFADTLHEQARSAAQRWDCATVVRLEHEQRARGSDAYLAFARDPVLASCLSPQGDVFFSQPSDPWATAQHRIGASAVLSGGTVFTAGAALRYELRFGAIGLTGRLTGMRGSAIGDEGNGFDAGSAQLGVRFHSDGWFLALEAGAAAIKVRPFLNFDNMSETFDWTSSKAGTLTIGRRLRGTPLEIGVSALYPFQGVGASVGADFARW